MFFILVVLAFGVILYFECKKADKKHFEWQKKNWKAYEDFLAQDSTMTEEEKQKENLWFMLTGKTNQPYSGRKFDILPKD